MQWNMSSLSEWFCFCGCHILGVGLIPEVRQARALFQAHLRVYTETLLVVTSFLPVSYAAGMYFMMSIVGVFKPCF